MAIVLFALLEIKFMYYNMKNLTEYINEGLFSRIKSISRKKKTGLLNIPDEMPKKYVEFFKKYFWGPNIDRSDVKNEKDVEEYLRLACDEFWDMIIVDYRWNPDKHRDDFEEEVLDKWLDQIIKIALK